MSDLISRQDAIDRVVGTGYAYQIKENILFILKTLPSAEPRTGKWVLKEHLWECDQCGCRINRAKPLKGNIWNYNYCPNCGAKMCKGGDDE